MSRPKPVEIVPGVHWYATGAFAGNIYFVQSASSWVLIDTATAGQGAWPWLPTVRRRGRRRTQRLRV